MKVICQTCHWVGDNVTEALSAPHPFDPGEEISFCPSCKQPNPFKKCCDEPGCREVVTTGWKPSGSPHRWTCQWHYAGWLRIRDLPPEDQASFKDWLVGQTTPEIPGLPDEEQDGYYQHDYIRWKAGLPVID